MKYNTFILYLAANIFYVESMTPLRPEKHHRVLRMQKRNATDFDPAPSRDLRRKRRLSNQEIISVLPPLGLQSSVDQMAQKALKNFYQKNVYQDNVVPTMSTKRPEVNLLPFDLSRSSESVTEGKQISSKLYLNEVAAAAKRSTGVLKQPYLRSQPDVPVPADSLPLVVLENLVMAIHRTSNKNVADVIGDIRNKLDTIYSKHVGTPDLRQRAEPSTTGKPKTVKPKNIIKEMDNILDNFLRAGKHVPENVDLSRASSESSSDDDDEDNDDEDDASGQAPNMRGAISAMKEKEDLEYDLDGGELNVTWKP